MEVQTPTPPRIVIADDHPLFRYALVNLLGRCANLEAVAEANDGQEALEFCRRFGPDVVLMDVIMPMMDGLEATRAIKRELPRIIVLMITASGDLEHLSEALLAGAAGYILKSAPPQEITNAIIRAVEGEFPLSHEVAMPLLRRLLEERQEVQRPREARVAEALPEGGSSQLPAPPPSAGSLSPRELEVLRHIAREETNQQIAGELLLSISHRKEARSWGHQQVGGLRSHTGDYRSCSIAADEERISSSSTSGWPSRAAPGSLCSPSYWTGSPGVSEEEAGQRRHRDGNHRR